MLQEHLCRRADGEHDNHYTQALASWGQQSFAEHWKACYINVLSSQCPVRHICVYYHQILPAVHIDSIRWSFWDLPDVEKHVIRKVNSLLKIDQGGM